MWKFIGKVAFWRLLHLAWWLGAKAFNDAEHELEMHGRLSRQWVYDHIWRPRELKARASKGKLDDAFFAFGRGYQRWDIEEKEQEQKDAQTRGGRPGL